MSLLCPHLRSGRPVITANKALLAEKWDELRAYALDGKLYYEASVMAGTPVIGPMSTVLRASTFERLQAVLNGTCLYIITQMEQGKDKVEAVIEAAVLRLRPILMTTGAMVLGAIPLALATGAGAESRHEIGWARVGGMTFGTAFTLFIVPAFYTLLSRRKPEPVTHVVPDGVAVPAE